MSITRHMTSVCHCGWSENCSSFNLGWKSLSHSQSANEAKQTESLVTSVCHHTHTHTHTDTGVKYGRSEAVLRMSGVVSNASDCRNLTAHGRQRLPSWGGTDVMNINELLKSRRTRVSSGGFVSWHTHTHTRHYSSREQTSGRDSGRRLLTQICDGHYSSLKCIDHTLHRCNILLLHTELM